MCFYSNDNSDNDNDVMWYDIIIPFLSCEGYYDLYFISCETDHVEFDGLCKPVDVSFKLGMGVGTDGWICDWPDVRLSTGSAPKQVTC